MSGTSQNCVTAAPRTTVWKRLLCWERAANSCGYRSHVNTQIRFPQTMAFPGNGSLVDANENVLVHAPLTIQGACVGAFETSTSRSTSDAFTETEVLRYSPAVQLPPTAETNKGATLTFYGPTPLVQVMITCACALPLEWKMCSYTHLQMFNGAHTGALVAK
jgi:hypothetical protein